MMKAGTSRVAKDTRRVARILPDNRSFVLLGYDPDSVNVTLERLAADVAMVIEEHFTGRVDIVGISYGGVVASHLAVSYPQRIAKLVLVASAHRFSGEGRKRLERQIELANAARFNDLLSEFTSMFRSRWLNMLVNCQVRLAGGRLVRRLAKPGVIVRHLEAMLSSPLAVSELRSISTEILIVVGNRDQFFGEATEEAATGIPTARLSMFEGETHMLPIERARDVKRCVSDFMARG
ncbi:alpha/beta fold hydrolase [Rhizobium mongolense]|uniref:alpha/beta fold hydrolase n=2 Tax=Rhizobium/Agrobacterium group TaxID=227290 RepID=UPI003555CBCA